MPNFITCIQDFDTTGSKDDKFVFVNNYLSYHVMECHRPSNDFYFTVLELLHTYYLPKIAMIVNVSC